MKWRPSGPNARIVLWTEWPWSLLMAWQGAYLSLYFVSRGAQPSAIGAAVGVSGLLQVVGLLGAGSLSNRMGRKAVIQWGDFLGWILVLGAWVVWPVPWVLLGGLVLQNATAFVGPAWNSLFTEDAPADRVEKYFLVLQVMTVLGGLAVPLMASWVARAGVRATGTTVLLWAWPLVSMSWLGRALWLRESQAGRLQQERWRARLHTGWRERLREGSRGRNRVLAAIRVFVAVPVSLMTVFIPLMLVSRSGEHLPAASIALLPLFGSAATLLLSAASRWWQTVAPKWTLSASVAALAVGFGVLTVAARGALLVVGLGWGLALLGQSLFSTVHTPLWLAGLSDEARVDVQGWIGAITGGLTAVLGPLLALILTRDARQVAGALAVLPLLALPLSLRLAGSSAAATALPPTANP